MCTPLSVYTHICVSVYVFVRLCIFMYSCECMSLYTSVYVCVCVIVQCVRVPWCLYDYVHVYLYTRLCICT